MESLQDKAKTLADRIRAKATAKGDVKKHGIMERSLHGPKGDPAGTVEFRCMEATCERRPNGSIDADLCEISRITVGPAMASDEFDVTVIQRKGNGPWARATVCVSFRNNRGEPSALIDPEFEAECEADRELCRTIFWSPDLQQKILSAAYENKEE